MNKTSRIHPQTSPVLRRAKRRARLERRRRFLKFSAAFTVMLVLGAAFLSVRSFAGTEDEAMKRAKYYKSVIIEKGDTINSIADEYMTSEYASRKDYVSEVVFINHIEDPDSIKAGTHLIIPYYAPENLTAGNQ